MSQIVIAILLMLILPFSFAGANSGANLSSSRSLAAGGSLDGTHSGAVLLSKSSSHELVFDHDFPDPSLILAPDGFYYAYSTQAYTEAENPILLNLQIARSKDLKSWELVGDALPVKPSWAKTTQSFWAPHIYSRGGTYYLFYSANPDVREEGGLCLAVATSASPRGPFTDSGRPMKCGSSYKNIDPMVFDDAVSQKTLMYWGSGFDPIRVRPLDSTLLSFEPGTSEINLVYPDLGPNPAPYAKLSEGAWMLERDGLYYLFVSGEDCCGQPDPQYAVLVLRSKSPFGPFDWKNGNIRESVVIESSGDFTATGHNSFITDKHGQLWSYYHGVDKHKPILDRVIPGDRVNRRVMLRSKIDFVDGWPVAH